MRARRAGVVAPSAPKVPLVPRDLAVLLPGQGSRTPDDLAVVERHAPDLLDKVRGLLGRDPFASIGERTAWDQPAIFCTSIALWRANAPAPDEVTAFAGHSLGELTALAIAGAIDVEDALKLVVLRGSLMDGARRGGMLALRAAIEDAEAIALAGGSVVANDNCPGQVVLAGDEAALDATVEEAAARGVRTLRLPVAGAFHSTLMAEAVTPFRRALEQVEVREPAAPVLCCATAEPFDDVREQLADALVSRVRWREVVEALHAGGAERFVDVGPGQVLGGLVKKTLGAGLVVA